MNKLEANLSLFAITFFAAIQYAFLTGVPEGTSHFLFLSLTNLLGFVFAVALFFKELFRVTKKLLLKCVLLALQLLGFHSFMLLGSTGTESTVVSCVLSSYFIFVVAIMFFVFKQKISFSMISGVVVVLIGLLLIFEAKFSAFLDIHVLYLLLSALFFAINVISIEKFAAQENPAMLAMGQMFFGFIFSAIALGIECLVKGSFVEIPTEPVFWGSVIFVSVFIRGIYNIVQIYAQRYISAFNTSLIFSTEIIMTMLMSPVISLVFGIEGDPITPIRMLGGFFMVAGILLADQSFVSEVKRRFHKNEKIKA